MTSAPEPPRKDRTAGDSAREQIERIGGYLHRVVSITDATGRVVERVVLPFVAEFRPRDLLQIVVGASILAIPVGMTEEVWKLAETLPDRNVAALGGISLLFIASFVYFNFYRYHLRGFVAEFLKRVASTYLFSLLVVAILLTLIQKCPWGADNLLAVKRIVLVAFPASMSAAVSDTLR